MSDIRANVKNTSVGRASSGVGSYAALRMTPDGALYTADASLSAALEGRTFAAMQGSVTTPIATAATTAIAAQRPMAWVRVPDGTMIVPLWLSILVESTGITTQGEIAVAKTDNDVGNCTSTAGPTPIALNSASGLVTSNCTVRRLATGDVTAETNLVEYIRFSFAASAVNQHYVWSAKETGLYLPLRGGASWLVYIGGNAVNFYITQVWAEFSEADYS